MPTRTRLPARRRRMNPTDWFGYSVADEIKVTVSSKPIETVLDMSSQQEDFHKPKGLWYACGGEWVDWLSSEMPEWLEEGKYLYEVYPRYSILRIQDFVRSPAWGAYVGGVLQLSTEGAVIEFNRIFRTNPTGLGSWGRRGWEIGWREVAQIWDGVEICPYHRGLEYNVRWYSSWDVASGCIWRPAGLASPLSLLNFR